MMLRGMVGAALTIALATVALAEVRGVRTIFAAGAVEGASDHLNLWCNSPQSGLTLDNASHTGFASVTATWLNMPNGAFVSTPEGVVMGTSTDGTTVRTALTVQPRERQHWEVHPNFSGTYHFAVIGETHNAENGSRMFGKLSKDMASRQLQFAVHLGNAAKHGNAGQLQLFREQLRSFPFPTYVIPGNEDVTAGGRKTWRHLFGDVPLSFSIGKDRFLLVDNAFGKIDPATMKWLVTNLKAANDEHARHIFVFLHQPLVDLREGLNQGMRDIDEVRTLLKLFQSRRVHTVFAGHIPLYARETRGGVYYVTTGGGGEKIAPHAGTGGFYHYVRVDVNGDDVKAVPIRFNDPGS